MNDREFKTKHNTIADNIIWLIKNHPSVAGDYRKLVHYYWYYIDKLNVFVPMEILETLTQPESVSRAFRKMVAEGRIDVDEKTKTARLRQERLYKEYYK